MNYFHVCSTRLGPGSIIEAGNWGSVISKFEWAHSRALFEAVLEHIRETEFPDLPSRLRSAFALPDRATAELYRAQASGGMGWIYEVEFVRPVPIHRANWNGVSPSGTLGLRWAKEYWWGVDDQLHLLTPPVPTIELFSESDLRIIQRLDE